MSTKGAQFSRGNVGANVISSDDSTSALVMHGVAIANQVALNEVKTLYQLKDAENLGLDKAYDTTNAIRVWYHIKEFYRRAGSGTKLFIMLVDNTLTANASTVTMEDMVDKEQNYLKELLIQAKGEVKQCAVAISPAAGYVSTILDGLDADCRNAILKAKGLVDWSWETNRPMVVLLEGREFSGTIAAAQDLRDIENLNAEGVGVVIAQDYDYAETLDDLGKKHASVGTALGVMASIGVARNIGEVETQNLADVSTSTFLTPALSSHQRTINLTDVLETLDGKGYIFAFSYTDYDGTYFNGDHACTEVIEDSEGNFNNYALAYSRVVGKVSRSLRNLMLPKVKKTKKINRSTGKLDAGTIASFNAIGDDLFLRMERNEEISGGKTYTNKDSNLLIAPRVLEVDFAVVPLGTIDSIKASINIKKRL